MLVCEVSSLGGELFEVGSIDSSVEVPAQAQEALQNRWLFQKMLHPQRARVAKFESKALMGGSVEVQFSGEAIEGVVHGDLCDGWLARQT